MGALLLLVLPAALIASVNPTAMGVEIAVLSWSKKAALVLVAAFTLVFILVGVLLLGVGLSIPDEQHSPLSGIIDCCLAALMFVLGWLALLNRPRRAMQTISKPREGMSLKAGFVLGLGLGITNPSSLIPYASALKDIGTHHVGLAGTLLAALLVLLILMAPMALPVGLAYAAPQTADRVLQPLNRFLTQHGHTLMGAFSLAFSVYLAVKGIYRIAPFV
jgi:hypothetical protein